MCYHQSTRTHTVYIFILRFSAIPFLGLVGEAASTPICVHPPSGAAGICPLGFFSVTRCIPTPWIFYCTGFSAMSDLESLLRAPLHYWGPFFVSDVFGGGPRLPEFFSDPSRMSRIVCPICYPQGSPLLYPGLQQSDRSSRGASVGYCLSLSSLWRKGIQSSSLGMTCNCKRLPRKFDPCLLFSSSCDRERLDGISSFLSDGIHFCGRLYSCSVKRRG